MIPFPFQTGQIGLTLDQFVDAGFIVSVTSSLFDSAVVTHDVLMPATVRTGDLLLVCFSTSEVVNIDLPAPTGWTTLVDEVFDQPIFTRQSWFLKVAIGNEDATTVNFATNNPTNGVAQVYRILAGTYNTTLPIEFGFRDQRSTLTPTPPAAKSPVDEGVNNWLVTFAQRLLVTVTGYPVNYFNGVTDVTSGGSPTTLASAQYASIVQDETPGGFTLAATNTNGLTTTVVFPEVGRVSNAPTVVESLLTSINVNQLNHPIDIPAVAAGARVIIQATVHLHPIIVDPVGWTRLDLRRTPFVANGMTQLIYYKDFASASAASVADIVTTTNAFGTGIAWVITPGTYDTGTPPEVVTTGNTSTPNCDTPVITPSWGVDDTLFFSVLTRPSIANAVQPGLNWCNFHQGYRFVTATNNGNFGAWRRAKQTTSTVTRWTFLITLQWCAAAIAVRKA